jgi:hypothetical protein
MRPLGLLPALEAAVRVTEVIKPHREPTPPPVIPVRFGKGQHLTYLVLVAQAAGAVVPFHHTRVNLLVTQEIQHMRKPRFAMDHVHLYPLNPRAFVAFLDLAVGQALSPTDHRPTALVLWRVTTTEHVQKSRLIAGTGIGKNRWYIPLNCIRPDTACQPLSDDPRTLPLGYPTEPVASAGDAGAMSPWL